MSAVTVILVLFVVLVALGCGAEEPGVMEAPVSLPVLLAAGDIASCESSGDEATARLLRRLPGTVAALGDQAYEDGSSADYRRCYDPSWGQFGKRTRPAAGNHEYETRNADGYFDRFGPLAGPRGKGWYSYRLGSWHVVVLNSNCSAVGGCAADSPQGRWLRADLAKNRRLCTLAYWHHPRFSSGIEDGSQPQVRPFWELLYNAGADVVLSAHEHNYERFAPQTPSGRHDARRGIRAFVVGTGGRSHDPLGRRIANSRVADDKTFGVLRLDLRPGRYTWRFIPVAPGGFSDSGASTCHR